MRISISSLKSTLRTDFSEVKSVFGFRVRLGNPDLDFQNLNPDFPIERTLTFAGNFRHFARHNQTVCLGCRTSYFILPALQIFLINCR